MQRQPGILRSMKIYDFEYLLLSLLPRKDVINLCAVLRHSLSIEQKKKYYKDTYLERGVSISYLNGTKYSIRYAGEIEQELGNWIDAVITKRLREFIYSNFTCSYINTCT